jgi:predicted HTH transcriptional regulator
LGLLFSSAYSFKAELELSTVDQKAELLKDITAMANTYDDGNGDYGFIIYGVSTGKVKGISVTETDNDKLQNTVDQLLKENIAPMPLVYLTPFEEPTGEKWGALVIAPRNNKPYMFFKDISCQNPQKKSQKRRMVCPQRIHHQPWAPRGSCTNNAKAE